ncbi:phosphatase PAP2 family protein [Crateriforma conspicua]|uniref:PAP2 superfamily protein n=1 Tax=Crateriforma conspicua TaxID=2527996 RepID=A0A5C5YAX8_9PLAN|nr:phosphatase PAP2 family protein [Crateriforma conspicua]TWT71475.1 PAP2 superfamily protein [Crateriforma conspicua]
MTRVRRIKRFWSVLVAGTIIVSLLPNSLHADDPINTMEYPPTRLVSLPSAWQNDVAAPSFDTELIGREPIGLANCDGIVDPYLLESQAIATGRATVTDRGTLWQRIKSDHRNYYDLHSFKLLAGGFLVGAAVANTQLDQEIQNHFQTSVRGATSDDWFEGLHGSKELGNGRYTLPIFASAWAAGAYFDETPVLVTTGRWGERSMRSFLVGASPLILAQRLTGGSRPGEKDRGARWLPFQDNNGVSGHAFMSSLPFINAAKMTERPWLKTAYYAASLLGPLSRVNDDDHYPSQVALGWWMAYVAATAIDRTELAEGNVQFYPYMAAGGGVGGMMQWRY